MSDENRWPLDVVGKQKVMEKGFFESLCLEVANGGSIIEVSEKSGVAYAPLLMWVNADAERKQLYEAALKSRDEFMVLELLRELRRMGTVDIRQAFNAEGGLKPIQEIPADVAACIAAIESEELFEGRGEDREQVGELKKIKFWDKIRALELLGKKLALWVNRVEVSGHVTLAAMVAASMKNEPDRKVVEAVVEVVPQESQTEEF